MKRKIVAGLLCLLLVLSGTLSARADSTAATIQIYASVNSNGDAEVTMTVRLRLEQAVDTMTFPLPAGAENISLNEKNVNTTKTTSAVHVDITEYVKGYTGEVDLNFHYEMTNVVRMMDEKMTLILPLLSGFSLPVDNVILNVMLPGTITGRPVFKSTYHQDDIETILSAAVNNNVVTGRIVQQLKDRETLTMTMTVTPEMFGGVSTYVRVGNPEVVPMGICAALAFLYWLLFLRSFPLLRERRATAPEGITAGELGNRLTFCGADLTMMVFSWAKLGYITIHMDDDGRVTLHKRMEMGNERSAFESKTFQTLFGKRRYIDGTGNGYAMLARKVASTIPGKKILCNPRGGNVKLFRWLGCGVQLFCGVCLAMNFTGITALQWILAVVLGALGALSAWVIQSGMWRLHLRYRLPVVFSLVTALVWVGLGLWAGQLWIALFSVLAQLLVGIAGAYGGRRTDIGRLNGCQILGYRHYLKTVSKEELNRIQMNDPEYFYNTLPDALALGVDRKFAKNFGHRKLPPCPYFHCGIHERLTAEEWVDFLHEAAEILDSRQRQMAMEKYAIVHFGR